MRRAALVVVMIVALVCPRGYAAERLSLPAVGTLLSPTAASAPLVMKGLSVHPKDPLQLEVIMDTGSGSKGMDTLELKQQSERLVGYFLAGLAIQGKDVWVNLSPYEKDKMIPLTLAQTVLGRDMLAQDDVLKQFSASLLYPESPVGKKFWQRLNAALPGKQGRSMPQLNAIHKIWVVADRARIQERGNAAYVVDAHLKVMLEQDYLALRKNVTGSRSQRPVNPVVAQVMREVLVPEIEKEINEGGHFAPLRQMFQGLILASWYKKHLKGMILNTVYADTDKVGGVRHQDPSAQADVYAHYLAGFKKGVFNYIKEEKDAQGTLSVRHYFSGGLHLDADRAMTVEKYNTAAMIKPEGDLLVAKVFLTMVNDQAMAAKPKVVFFDTQGWDEEQIRNVYAKYEVVFVKASASEESIEQNREALKDAVAVNVFIASKMSPGVIAKLRQVAPNLKVLATRSAGTDHIDFGAAKANGIEVVNVPDYGSQSIAEYAVTLALSLAAGLSPKDGQEDMGRVEYGLARLFAHAKKLDETISRVRAGNYQRSGLKGLNLLDQSQDRKIFIGGKNDAPDEAVLKEIGLKIAQDPGEADFYWGDAQQIKISEIKQGAIVINMGDIPNAELTGQFKARGAVLETIPKKVKGVSLRGRTMGVIGGAGKIGINTVRIARALGMIVLVYDVDMVSGQAVGLKKQYGFEYASLEELLSRSDVVSLHVPFIPGKTEHMIDAKRIAMMKQGAMLINTARGPVVDTPAVIEALKSGHIAAAGLDVIEGEPGIFPQAQGVAQQATEEQKINLNTLAAMPNVYVTPHNAFNTTASAWSMLHITAQSITDKTADPASVAVVKKPAKRGGIDLDTDKMILDTAAVEEWPIVTATPEVIKELSAGNFTGIKATVTSLAPVSSQDISSMFGFQ